MPRTLKNLVDHYLQIYLGFYPTAATSYGYRGFDGILTNYDDQHISHTLSELEALTKSIALIQPKNKDEAIDQDLLKHHIQTQIFGLKKLKSHELNPNEYISTVSNSLWSLMMSQSHTAEEKVEFITERLKATPAFLKQGQEHLKSPVKLWTSIALKEAPGLLSYLKESILPFLTSQKVSNAQELIERTNQSVENFMSFLKTLSKLNNDFSIGKGYFEFLLKTFHKIEDSAETIRDLGFQQIEILTEKLRQQATKIDSHKSWQELIEDFKNDHPTEDNLLKSYQDKVDEIKKFLIEKDLVTLPKVESLKIIETPAFLQNSIPFAAYSGPTMFADDGRGPSAPPGLQGPLASGQGHFFVTPVHGNQELLKDHCHTSFPLTALHEGYPGHHLQFATQRTLSSPIRKIYDVATYFEGWTLYCEEMMYQEGFYSDAMRLYQLKDRLWRAARIVVDTSMHCFGMSDDEAVQFLVDKAKLSLQGARVDVNWYTQSPTTPMSYLYGTLQVDQLRDDYLKTGKSLREFHDAFLQTGAIPLPYVRQLLLG